MIYCNSYQSKLEVSVWVGVLFFRGKKIAYLIKPGNYNVSNFPQRKDIKSIKTCIDINNRPTIYRHKI